MKFVWSSTINFWSPYDQWARATRKHKLTKRCTLTVINNL